MQGGRLRLRHQRCLVEDLWIQAALATGDPAGKARPRQRPLVSGATILARRLPWTGPGWVGPPPAMPRSAFSPAADRLKIVRERRLKDRLSCTPCSVSPIPRDESTSARPEPTRIAVALSTRSREGTSACSMSHPDSSAMIASGRFASCNRVMSHERRSVRHVYPGATKTVTITSNVGTVMLSRRQPIM